MKNRTPERLNKIKQVLKNRISNIRIGIFDIFKEHNISAILRTVDFLGFQYVDVIGELYYKKPMPINKKVTRGVEKWLTISYFKTGKDYWVFLKKNNYKIYITYLDRGSKNYSQIDYSDRISIIFGNEFNGITDSYLIEHCDEKIIIPQRGFAQSLNVSVSVGVILSTIINQTEKKLTSLSREERQKLEELWKKL